MWPAAQPDGACWLPTVRHGKPVAQQARNKGQHANVADDELIWIGGDLLDGHKWRRSWALVDVVIAKLGRWRAFSVRS